MIVPKLGKLGHETGLPDERLNCKRSQEIEIDNRWSSEAENRVKMGINGTRGAKTRYINNEGLNLSQNCNLRSLCEATSHALTSGGVLPPTDIGPIGSKAQFESGGLDPNVENKGIDEESETPNDSVQIETVIDDKERWENMMKTDDLFTIMLKPKDDNDESQRHLSDNNKVISIMYSNELKDDLGMEPYSDPSEILTRNMGQNEREKVAKKVSKKPGFSRNPLMPNPPIKPTGFFLMGEGGGVDPH